VSITWLSAAAVAAVETTAAAVAAAGFNLAPAILHRTNLSPLEQAGP
jgi:hypothetical protein